MSAERQKELFEEFKEGQGKIRQIADKIGERQHRLYLHLPLENIIFIAIIIIMGVIVSFALGVERGKRLNKTAEETPETQTAEQTTTLPSNIKHADIAEGQPSSDADKSTDFAPASEDTVRTEGVTQKSYTIQLISYKQKRLAEREIDKLQKKGVEAYIIRSGKWYQICAGDYDSVDEAKHDLKKFEDHYKGCFIRKGEK